MFFPDEIIYSSLARGIAESGTPAFLGHPLDFPALLTAYLTAPLWLISDTTVAYHLVQSLGALAFSLAAIPVFLLARRLSLSTNTALLLAAGTLVLPDLALSSLLLSEPFAFALFGFTFWAGHRALLSVQSLSDQLLFLGLLALLCLARTQFIILPAAYLFALLVQGRVERRVRDTLRAQLPLLLAFSLPIPIAAVLGLTRVFGFYTSIADYLTPAPSVSLHWLVLNLLVLALSCGWLLAPGAVLGFEAALRRPDDRAERGFALLFLPILLGLLAQATIISSQVKDAQGRYLIYALPLLLILFALAARRGLLIRWANALGLLALIPVALLSPISELNRASLNSAPILLSRHELERVLGVEDAYASIPFLLAGLAVFAVYAWWKRSGPALVGLIATFLVAASVGGTYGQRLLASDKVTPAHRPFLSSARIERALFLVGTSSQTELAMSTVFWNREISQVVSLTALSLGALPVDGATAAPDGTLLIDGDPYTGPLVVDSDALETTIRGVEPSRTSANVLLFRAAGAPVRLRTLVTGLVGSGLGRSGSLQAWPARPGGDLRGTLTFTLFVPRSSRRPTVVDFRLPAQSRQTVTIEPGQTRTIALVIRSEGMWQAFYRGRGSGYRSGSGFALAELQDLDFRFSKS
ncbi:MAG: hypothetical protein MSC30_00805 [Gaiellaceae bacterium MAG52_C11]|nr:hypothetical protein [Candidatus Gaiellasilicea maunaloa]